MLPSELFALFKQIESHSTSIAKRICAEIDATENHNIGSMRMEVALMLTQEIKSSIWDFLIEHAQTTAFYEQKRQARH
jgi:hypothetical protein